MLRLGAAENGAVHVEGDGGWTIRRDGREQRVERVRLALCRCGASGSKPYCDMSHAAAGLVAARTELEPGRVPGEQPHDEEVSVKITAMENGPNKVEVEGATAWRVVRAGVEETIARPAIFLCRCGQSQNKPFCDGTHNKVGFVAPGAEIEIAPA